MRLLLDTHTFLWFVEDNINLSQNARTLIEDEANQPLLSLASVWEIAIKTSIGKLNLKQPFEVFIPQQISLNSFTLLDIRLEHIAGIISLPQYHRDPFDRLLIAQAIHEQIPIISTDVAFDQYPVTRLW